jgi:hypothetical protein
MEMLPRGDNGETVLPEDRLQIIDEKKVVI